MCGNIEIERQEFHKDNKSWMEDYDGWIIHEAYRTLAKEPFGKVDSKEWEDLCIKIRNKLL